MADRIRAITVPKWGLAMKEGTIVAWYVEEGGQIKTGDDLVEIETPKISNVCESPASGIVRRRVARIGETLPVGSLLAVLAKADVPDDEIDAFVAEFRAEFVPAAAGDTQQEPGPEYVEAEGMRIRYLRMGEAEGVPILMVHGFGGDLNSWLFSQSALARQRAVYAVDLPGHGGSAKEVGRGDMKVLTAALLSWLDQVGLARVHFVAHSLGGAVALNLALNHPARVGSLTLIAPIGFGPEIDIGYIEDFIQASRHKQLRPVVEKLFANPALVGRKMLDDIISYKRLDGATDALRTIAGAFFSGGRQVPFLAPRLSELRIPVQIIWGGQDRIVPVEHARNLPPSAEAHLLRDAGHMVHMEEAQEVNALIERFIHD